ARQQQAEAEAREKRERAQLQKQVDALMLLARLRELRRLRGLRARRHGRVVEGDEDAFMRAEQSAEEARASVGGSSGDGRDAGGMEACQGQSHRGDRGSRERGAQSARAGESGGKEGLPSCDGLPVLSSAAAHHLSLHGLAAVRRQWDAFLLPLPCSAPTPHPQVPRRPLGALVPSTSHTPHTRQLLAATSFMREGLLPFSAPAAPAAGSAPVAAASLPSGAHAAGAHAPSAHAPGASVPPCWVPAPQPATSEWRRYLRKNG
ncbi:unnamed protein product, partial [Closterium sp. Naga37s-1]